MNILVTGGAGQIGSMLTQELEVLGHTVVVWDRAGGEIDSAFWQRASPVGEYEWIIHLGAVSDARSTDSVSIIHSNYLWTLSLLEYMKLHPSTGMIFTSSAAYYGLSFADRPVLPFVERNPPNPMNEYGISKVASEMAINNFRRAYPNKIYVFRLSNVWGPGIYKGVVHEFIKRMSRDEDIAIHSRGNQVRDFVYIDDVVQVMTEAVANPTLIPPGTYNVSSGKGTKIRDLFEMCLDLYGKYSGSVRFSGGSQLEGDSILSNQRILTERSYDSYTRLHFRSLTPSRLFEYNETIK